MIDQNRILVIRGDLTFGGIDIKVENKTWIYILYKNLPGGG